MRRLLLAAATLLIAAGCGSSATPGSSPTPSGASLSQVELKYRLLAQVGPIDYCDPDAYPLARMVTPQYAAGRLASIQASDGGTYREILSHYGFPGVLNTAQQLQVYSDYKELEALRLTGSGGRFEFAYFVAAGAGKEPILSKGTIDPVGAIAVASRVPSRFSCPICLAGGTLIESPDGPLRAAELRAGMTVWTTGPAGERKAAPLLRVGSMTGGPGFILHLQLADGRAVWVSPRHPLPDGRLVGELERGDRVDGSVVVLTELIPSSAATYDLLPAGPTGAYWADGILLASTLKGAKP